MLRVKPEKVDIMNSFRALAWIASAPLQARANRRTASIINALPDEVQKDIGWKWTANRRAPVVRSTLDWDLL